MTNLILILFLILTGKLYAKENAVLSECSGCHSSKYRLPLEKFSSGLGKWGDFQCVGCHTEINEISRNLNQSHPSKLNFNLPLSFESQIRISSNPLSLQTTPILSEQFPEQTKYTKEGLSEYLKRAVGSGTKMLSFPKSFEDKILVHLNSLQSAKIESKFAYNGAKIFSDRNCIACHAPGGNLPNYLDFVRFSPQFILEVASGKISKKNRKMPKIELSLQESSDILSWIFSERKSKIEQIDTATLALEIPKTLFKIPNEFPKYLFGQFLKDGTCVHCHSTLKSASSSFNGSSESLQKYILNGGAKNLWTRLSTRKLEQQIGIVSFQPGMPMTGEAMPSEFLNTLAAWIQQKCKNETGMNLCN